MYTHSLVLHCPSILIGLVDALISSMNHSANLHGESDEHKATVHKFTGMLTKAIHNTFRYGQGTQDMAGPSGLSTEDFVGKVAWRLGRYSGGAYRLCTFVIFIVGTT